GRYLCIGVCTPSVDQTSPAPHRAAEGGAEAHRGAGGAGGADQHQQQSEEQGDQGAEEEEKEQRSMRDPSYPRWKIRSLKHSRWSKVGSGTRRSWRMNGSRSGSAASRMGCSPEIVPNDCAKGEPARDRPSQPRQDSVTIKLKDAESKELAGA